MTARSIARSFVVSIVFVVASFSAASAAADLEVLAVDRVGDVPGVSHAADVLSVGLRVDPVNPALRISFLSLERDPAGLRPADKAAVVVDAVPLTVRTVAGGRESILIDTVLRLRNDRFVAESSATKSDDPDAVWIPVDPALLADGPVVFEIATTAGETVRASYPADKAYAANCALVLHGNQSLGYSDVFHGRGDDEAGSGFDEALEVHQATGVPGNFHLSGPLQTSAEWAHNQGDSMDFNAWLATGCTDGWAGMITSAYAQHIMPFVTDDMNDWAVNIETQMMDARYGYYPRVAWVPERVWLTPGVYPDSGVIDWIGDNFQGHGVWGVILDDDVHLTGHDNHQIHTATNGLRLVPRDRTFTGNIVGGDGQSALDILTGLASSGVGEYRIAVLAEDWEAIAEMGGWADVTPNAVETYEWFVNKCSTESSWLSTWKLADALSNANFTGDTFDPTNGTYNEIGGFDGYGGGDNGWYPHWAAWVPYVTGGDGSGVCAGAGGSCKDYGTIWSDAYNALMAAPDNAVSQAGWYVLMTNLYETAWHDGLGGDISGWEHNLSSHIKNATVFAEVASWANGDYTTTTAAYFSDIDGDGYDELIMHSDKLFAVLEGNGGRLVNLFVKDAVGVDSAVGVDNAYWSGTLGDFNDSNHIGAFSDVSPDYQHSGYALEILEGSGPTVTVRATLNEVSKEISLTEGDAFLDAVYRVGPNTHWIQSGFSPGLVDLVWNAQMDRLWTSDQAYMGWRNPNTGLSVAWVLGTAGAAHQKDLTGTIMKGDEIYASGAFGLRLYAGHTSAPDGTGEVAEIRAVATALVDDLGPLPVAADYYPNSDRLKITFDQPAEPATLVASGFHVDVGGDGTIEETIDAGTAVLETAASTVLTLQLGAADAATLDALAPGTAAALHADAGSVFDVPGNGNDAVDETDGPALVLHADTQVTVDGNLETTEWSAFHALADSNDSAWTAANEIDGLYLGWDAEFLYVAIDGVVESNSWLLYLDVDPGGAEGETDLSSIDAWERGAVFTAAGFAADFQYGCYQHESVYDGDSFWEITSATTAVDRTGDVVSDFDSQHVYGDAGGSEIAIPWDVLFPDATGTVPVDAAVSLVASICWDPEPDGELGGDSVPNNVAAALPTLDAVWTVTVDGDGDGEPDPWGPTSVEVAPRHLRVEAWPNPFNPSTTIRFDLPAGDSRRTSVSIVNLRGERVAELVNEVLPAGRHETVWNGADRYGRTVAAGIYTCVVRSGDRQTTRSLTLVK